MAQLCAIVMLCDACHSCASCDWEVGDGALKEAHEPFTDDYTPFLSQSRDSKRDGTPTARAFSIQL